MRRRRLVAAAIVAAGAAWSMVACGSSAGPSFTGAGLVVNCQVADANRATVYLNFFNPNDNAVNETAAVKVNGATTTTINQLPAGNNEGTGRTEGTLPPGPFQGDQRNGHSYVAIAVSAAGTTVEVTSSNEGLSLPAHTYTPKDPTCKAGS